MKKLVLTLTLFAALSCEKSNSEFKFVDPYDFIARSNDGISDSAALQEAMNYAVNGTTTKILSICKRPNGHIQIKFNVSGMKRKSNLDVSVGKWPEVLAMQSVRATNGHHAVALKIECSEEYQAVIYLNEVLVNAISVWCDECAK